ncbi:MAG: competence/damage-inducible protein A [Vicinamibacteria bacterium]|nr:competence/damage-inducible protein A [Vicinamibacteria bacterium]
MQAELLAVGSELLVPGRQETNAATITRYLLERGCKVVARTTIADDARALTDSFRLAWSRADLVIATGGLGPTEDDLTRECAASALGAALIREASYVEWLKERFKQFGRVMPNVNEKQADRIEGGRLLMNPKGTAPGQMVERDGKILVLLPGPPREMLPLFEREVLPLVEARSSGERIVMRIIRIAGMGESDVEQMVAPIYKTFSNPMTTILGGASEVELQLVGTGRSEALAEERVEDLASKIRDVLGARIFTESGETIERVVAGLLAARGLKLTLAESCTGGLVTARLVSVAGASSFLDRAFVTYSDQAKMDELGVEEATLKTHGAVSEDTALEMAKGARAAARADVALAITGIAGPAGGTAQKPVGLVCFALDGALGQRTVRRVFPSADRERVIQQASNSALEILRRALVGFEG